MKKAGTNDKHQSKPQAPGRMNPASFKRNNMSMGGVNNQMLGSVGKSTGTAKRK